ncbi:MULTISPECIES: ribose-phosphate pyrophosphokinase [Sphingopyxis]|uniref:ribose-phosphate pyrophosphokinase n=1 Tax=Sphingopyxis TaxID=165697 RepID=UPI00086E864C|nr:MULTISPECIES: ribose-phosphate pyrophosphokinase [Sphingopyxis]APW73351.1 ribose-phosphate pyrophosphokinase [Sphingopyxis granuli]AVA14380.1 ribose-phosphate pyrophosphokinase [Sphingopyxis sp. MG]ODU24989.1 MAG: ribose-phosphate pyrophosphokinase [Sphingopyxis sp. SCN 67-31]
MAAGSKRDEGLGDAVVPADASALGDAPRIRAILTDAAREGRPVSYSELLGELGFRFTRPKMRAVCRTLAEVDRLCALDGEPDLAVLVVRESDGLPGQGWWVGGTALLLGYDGPWEGAAAARFIKEQQQDVFDYWAER